jgi:hypothetical protein
MRKYRQSWEERIISGFFSGLWRLITWPFRRKSKISQYGATTVNREEIQARWQKIEDLAKLQGESRFKQAVLDADNLLDLTIKSMGIRGETMGERLKNAKGKFSQQVYDGLWQAHKLRNEIVHNINYQLVYWQANGALAKIKKGLREAKVIE